MANRPQEHGRPLRYHAVAERGTPEEQKWIGPDCDPSDYVTLLKGPRESWTAEGIQDRVDEYADILRRMADRRFYQPDLYGLHRRAHELYFQPDELGRKRTQAQVAGILSRETGRSFSQKDVSPMLKEWEARWQHYETTGDTTSVGPTFRRQPPRIPE